MILFPANAENDMTSVDKEKMRTEEKYKLKIEMGNQDATVDLKNKM